jgi:hypothetical protein
VTGAIDETLGRLSPFLQKFDKIVGNDLLTKQQHAFRWPDRLVLQS